ncbi:Clusterin-associated protein-1-domain-containing protein [Haematococcus lacustris]
MSFRELRSFTEIMKSLGYTRLISMENFKLPNFELVADCLYWLVQRYYPGVDIADEISTETDRVKFLQSVAQVMLTKARMKLNIKKLYSADSLAVKELLKVASLLYKATEKAAIDEDQGEAVDFAVMLKGFNPKEIKANAAEIIKAGASLYDALGQEPELREHRARAVAGHVDTEFVERSIQEAINQVEDHVSSLEQQLDELERNEKTLDSKIEKKKQELERNEKRLSTLQSVRPAYMDEYERLQVELNLLYSQYLDKFRNLEFLENELTKYYDAEQDKLEKQERRLMKMQKKLRTEELRILRGELEVDEEKMGLGGMEDEEEDDGLDDLDSLDDQDSRRALAQNGGGGGGRGPGALGQSPPGGKQTLRRAPGGEAAFQGAVPGGRGAQGPGGGGHRVMGHMGNGYDDDEASIDEDENSDGGEVSIAGSDPGRRNMDMGNGYGGGYGAGVMQAEEDEEEDNDF